MRMLCSQGNIDAQRFRNGFLSRPEWAQIAKSLGTLADAKIFLDDTPAFRVLEMRAKARRLAAEQKRLDLIVVDYLQLMSGSAKRVRIAPAGSFADLARAKRTGEGNERSAGGAVAAFARA